MWVEHETCEACAFDGAVYTDAALLDALRGLGPSWRALVRDCGPDLRMRPAPGVWSAIEYAAHSRDITALHAFGVERALTVDEPTYPAVDDDLVEAAAADYSDLDPDDVVRVLDSEATRLAQLAANAGSGAWSRGLTIGESRSEVRRLLEHALHDSLHHLDDVDRNLESIRSEQR